MQLSDRRFFGLLGEVVDGNPTQEMIEAAFASAGLPWRYISMPVPVGTFAQAMAATRQLGFSGLHITKPYKIDAVDLVDELTPAAAKIGAVNCVSVVDGTMIGDNTDGRGLVNALNGTCEINGASVVVLGAGGAARAIAMELGIAGAKDITVVNRSAAPGESLVEALSEHLDCVSRFQSWSETFSVTDETDLVVNATSMGMFDHDEMPDIDLSGLKPSGVVADAVIAPRPTAILAAATQLGRQTVSGAEMLVEQAAISFDLWAGQPADTTAMRGALDESLVVDQEEQPC